MAPVPLLVLGAQFTGLATALFLAHQGFPVHVLDRDPREAATADPIALGPRAVAELAEVGLAPALHGAAREPARLVHADACTGTVLRVAELGASVRHRYGHPYVLVARDALRAMLVAACEADEMVTVEYGRTVRAVDDIGDAALVTTDDGAAYRAEALVGADGASSRVRRHLGGGYAVSPPYVQHRTTGAGPVDDTIRVWSSPALHLTHVAGPDGRAEVSLTVRIDTLDDMHPDAVPDVAARLLAGSAPEVRAASHGAGAGPATRVLRHHAPLDRWVRHRMTVVGCAAQPMLPHTGQSTSLGLIDAATLGRAFDRTDGRIVPALEEYARVRAGPRAAAAQRALDFATLCHAEGLLRRMRDRLWRAMPVDATAAVADAHGPSPSATGGPATGGPPGPWGPVGPIAG